MSNKKVSRKSMVQPAPRDKYPWLLWCGIAGPVIFNIAYFTDGVLRNGYDGVTQTISALEGGNLGWIQRANFIVFGLLIFGFALAMKKILAHPWTLWIPLLYVLAGLGLIGDGIFLTDPLHLASDLLTLGSSMLNCFLFAVLFAIIGFGKGWVWYSMVTGFLMIVFLALFGISLSRHGAAGLFEKLAVIQRSIWSILLAAQLLKGRSLLSRSRSSSEPVLPQGVL